MIRPIFEDINWLKKDLGNFREYMEENRPELIADEKNIRESIALLDKILIDFYASRPNNKETVERFVTRNFISLRTENPAVKKYMICFFEYILEVFPNGPHSICQGANIFLEEAVFYRRNMFAIMIGDPIKLVSAFINSA